MKTIIPKAACYQKPLCQCVEVEQEGLLCTSNVAEDEFNSTIDDYVIKDESYW